MHILLIPSWYSTPNNPVRGSFFNDQALALHKIGHQVGMLVPPTKLRSWHGLAQTRAHWQQSPAQMSVEQHHGISVYRLPWWGWQAAILPWQRGKLGLAAFDEYCSREGVPDVLHGHSVLYGGYLAAYIGSKRGIPAVLTEHSTNFINGYILPPQGHFVRYTLRHTRRNLAVGAALAHALQAFASEQQVDIVANTIDTDFFKPGAQPLSKQPFIFSIIGSLIRRKGHKTLLEAFASAFHDADVILNIAGEGPTRPELERQVQQLGLQSQVRFLGRLSREQVRDLIQTSHCIVSASTVETFGVTVIEALACGKPVVATISGGPEDIINADSGLLVPPDNPKALAAALVELRRTYANFDAEKIRAYCIARFSEEAVASQLDTIYQSL